MDGMSGACGMGGRNECCMEVLARQPNGRVLPLGRPVYR